MKISLIMALCSAAIFVSGCAAGIIRTGYQLPKEQDTNNAVGRIIAVQRNATFDTNDVVILGFIHSYDTGFSLDCDEAYSLDIFCQEGRILGADLVNITEEKHPDWFSSCYRARAEFVRFKDREKVKSLYSDPYYAPAPIIDRSVQSGKRNRETIAAAVLGGILGALIVWDITDPHQPDHHPDGHDHH